MTAVMEPPSVPTGLKIPELIDLERDAGVPFGPFHRQWLTEQAPERARRMLERQAAHRRKLLDAGIDPRFCGPMNTRQGFGAMDINDFPSASFTARNTSASELNIIGDTANGATTQAMINQYCAIPANDARAGKLYEVMFGGVYSNTGTPTVIWTPRWGSSPTVATNVTLGASATVTTITGASALGVLGIFRFGIRTSPPGATAGTGIGRGNVCMAVPVTSSQYTQEVIIGGTVGTIDTTGQGTAGCGLTMNITWGTSSASNTFTCEWYVLRSLN